jgi:23S rRNA (adenine2503-C2)-methyltransferase
VTDTSTTKPSLSECTPDEMANLLSIKPFQGRQLFRWLHQKQVFDFDAMTDLSKDLRAKLHAECIAHRLSLVKMSVSPDTGTKKALLRLEDGETVESVLIRSKDRVTLCLSSQVGCAVNCSFCATGMSGFARNLTAGEIVEQALYLLADEDLGGRTPNIVYMGMGEPFRNYDAVTKSIRLLMAKDGLGIGARRITVSTAGELPGVTAFAQEDWQVRLSISLHAANDTLRDTLVPLNRKYNLDRMMHAVHDYHARAGRQVTYEWALLEGINDSPRDADELTALIGESKAFVNLIPYNPVEGLPYRPPTAAVCRAFRDRLVNRGIKATLRLERGQDIDAACGQLRRHTVS